MTTQSYTAKSPYCEHSLDPHTAVDGWVTCPCGRKSDVRWVSELGWLQARGQWVGERVSAGEAWFDTRVSQAAPTTAEPVNTTSTGQRVLYLLGALSLITAVAVFVAVAWQDIGALGQALTLLAISAGCAVLAVRTRASLPGLANTVAVISSGVAFTGLITAPQFGLLPSWWLEQTSSFYAVGCIAFVGLLSVFAGTRTTLAGWLLIGAPAMVAFALIVMQVNATHYLADSYESAVAIVWYSAAIVAINVRIGLTLRLEEGRFLNVSRVYALGQLLIGLVLFGYLTRLIVESGRWIIDGLGVLGAALLWTAVAVKSRAHAQGDGLTNLVPYGSKFISPALAGYSMTLLLVPTGYRPAAIAVWISTVVLALLGSALLLAPVFASARFDRLRMAFLTAAISVWVTSAMAIGSLNFSDAAVSKLSMTVYFVVVTAALATHWLQRNNGLAFIALNITGVIALLNILDYINTSRFEIEVTTIPVAMWLLATMLVLRWRRANDLNSGIWIGIPLAAALLPSAATSVLQLQLEPVTTADWVRMWTVLGVSVVLTVAGAAKRIAGLLWPGAIAYVLCTFPQLFTDLDLVIPRWVFFAFLGALLIATATRFERLQQLRRQAGSWDAVFR